MKTVIIFLVTLVFAINSCQNETSEWAIIYGELNDNLAYKQVDDSTYYYNNIEFFFINNKTKKCYRSLDSNQSYLATSLIRNKLSELSKNKVDKKIFQEANISTQKEGYINIEFIDSEGRQMLYKINVLDSLNDNVFVYTKYKNTYMETIWTDRKSRSRKTKKFKTLKSN